MNHWYFGLLFLAMVFATAGRADSSSDYRHDLDQWFGRDSPVFSQAVPAEYAPEAALAQGHPNALGEAKVRFLRRHLVSFLDACLAVPDCAPGALEREILSKTRLVAENKDAAVPEFAPGTDPRFTSATVDAHRFAVTQLAPGPIVFNDDQLATPPAYRILIALLVHETAHQAGYSDTAERELDEVGAAVASVVEKQSRELRLEGSAHEVFLTGEGTPSPVLAFSDGHLLLELTPLVPDALYRIVDIPVLCGFMLSNPHWKVSDVKGATMLYLEVDLEYRLSRTACGADTLSLLGRAQFAIPLDNGQYQAAPITTSVYDLREKPLATSPRISLRSLAARPVVHEGEDLEVVAEVQAPPSPAVDGAMISLTSDSFLRHPVIVPLRLYWSADRIESLDSGRYRLTFHFRLLPGTPSRTFRVESLFVTLKGMSTPARLLPTFRTTIRYEGKTSPPPLGLVAKMVSSMHGRNVIEALNGLAIHKTDEFVPRSLFTGSDFDRLNLWLEIDTPGNLSKAIVVLEGEMVLANGERRRKPFVLAVTESTQDGVLRAGSIKHNERGHVELQLELNPNRLPSELAVFRFQSIKVVTSYLQEALFTISE